MKKLISLVVVFLIISGIASCSKTPDAKELFNSATENTNTFDFSLDLEMQFSAQGESAKTTVSVDGTVDNEKNMNFFIIVGEPDFTYSQYRACLFPEEFEFYFRRGEFWISLDADDVTALTGQPFDPSILTNSEPSASPAEEELPGTVFSEAVKDGDVYKFSISFTDETAEYITRLTDQYIATLPADEAVSTRVIMDEINIGGLIKDIVIDIQVDAGTETFRAVSCDMSSALNNFLQKFMSVLGSMLPDANSADISADTVTLAVEFANVGNVTPIQLEESIKQSSMSVVDYIIMLLGLHH